SAGCVGVGFSEGVVGLPGGVASSFLGSGSGSLVAGRKAPMGTGAVAPLWGRRAGAGGNWTGRASAAAAGGEWAGAGVGGGEGGEEGAGGHEEFAPLVAAFGFVVVELFLLPQGPGVFEFFGGRVGPDLGWVGGGVLGEPVFDDGGAVSVELGQDVGEEAHG